MSRADIQPPVDPDDPIVARTASLVARFDQENKDYAFNDGGEGTTYAEWFADLLDEWVTKLQRGDFS